MTVGGVYPRSDNSLMTVTGNCLYRYVICVTKKNFTDASDPAQTNYMETTRIMPNCVDLYVNATHQSGLTPRFATILRPIQNSPSFLIQISSSNGSNMWLCSAVAVRSSAVKQSLTA